MDVTGAPATLPRLARRLLWADAAVEALVAVVLAGLLGPAHQWLDVSRTAALAGAGVFAVAAVAIAFGAIWRQTTAVMVRQLAFVNIAGGAAVWAVAILSWDRFDGEGRWLVGAVADSFIALGALELLALRQPPEND